MTEEENPTDEATQEIKKTWKDTAKSLSKNYWFMATVILALLLVGTFVTNGITGNVIKEGDMEEIALNFFNTKLSQNPGTLESLEKEEGIYKVVISSNGQSYPFYFTESGMFIYQGMELIPTTTTPTNTNAQTTSTDVPKSDKPVVDLFVMTHCPYGTQAEKGIIPVLELLGDKIDGNIRFVHYFMHAPEEAETPIQVCIREEEPDKYLDYLKCFLEGDGNYNYDSDGDGVKDLMTNGNDPTECMKREGIDTNLIDNCIPNKWETYYDADSKLSQNSGVSGSPALVINGQKISSARSPAAYLSTICSAFNTAPEECSQELSSETPSAYFGWDTTNSTSVGQC